MPAWGVTKLSGAHRPYLSCQGGGSPRTRAGHLPSFLFSLGTWHRAEHAEETPQRLGLEIKLRIRNLVLRGKK